MADFEANTVNLLVLDDERIRLRAVPIWSCVFDAVSWATRLVHWHLDKSWTTQPDDPEMAVWYRETAGEIEGWLTHRAVPSHPLLRARIALQPHTVGLRALPGYIDRILALGRAVEDDLVDVCLLLDPDGGAMYVEQACRAIHDLTTEAVDAEMVDSERMAEIVAPYVCYLGGTKSRDLAL